MLVHRYRFVLALTTLLTAFGPSLARTGTFTYGHVQLEFTEPPTTTASWHFRIWALSYCDFEDGKLFVRGLFFPDGPSTLFDTVLWKGSRSAYDTIYAEFTTPPLRPGDYEIYAQLRPIPERASNTHASGDAVYVTVREDRVLYNHAGWSGNYYQELLEELEARNLKGATEAEIWQKAPDLGARLRDRSPKIEPMKRMADSVVSSPIQPSVPPGRARQESQEEIEARSRERWEQIKAEREPLFRKAQEAKRERFRPGPRSKRGVRKEPTYDSSFEQYGRLRPARAVNQDSISTDSVKPDR